MSLVRSLRRYGLRDGWALWRFGRSLDHERSIAIWVGAHRPAWRRFHGDRASMPGHRKAR